MFSWCATFWGVAIIGVLAFIGLIVSLPTNRDEKLVHLASEVSALNNGKLSLLLTVFRRDVLAVQLHCIAAAAGNGHH